MLAGDRVAHAHSSHYHAVLPSWLASSCLCSFLPFVCLFGFNSPDYSIAECWAPFALSFCVYLPLSFAMSPRRKRNSFESSLPVASSSCSTSAVTSLPTVASAPALVPGTSASIDFARIFSFGYSAHSDTEFGHRTAVVICRSWRSFRFYARPSRHFCSRVAEVSFGQSLGTFGRLWHAPPLVLNHKRGISAIDFCWVPASECFDLVHFSASGFAVKRFARYVIVSFCSTFCLCVFLR